MTLGELPVFAYAPIWNIEHHRVEFLGPRSHLDVSVARGVGWRSRCRSSSHLYRCRVRLGATVEPTPLSHQCRLSGVRRSAAGDVITRSALRPFRRGGPPDRDPRCWRGTLVRGSAARPVTYVTNDLRTRSDPLRAARELRAGW
jgi:hypothetical protein